MDGMAGGGEGAGWILIVHPYTDSQRKWAVFVWNQYCSNAMAQSSQRLFENGSLQRTSVQHSFELLYVITGYCTLCRELALVGYYHRRSKLRSFIN